MTQPENQAEALDEKALRSCPFCGCDLYRKKGKHNPAAYCITENCYGSKMPVVNLDVPEDVAAWNRRASLPEAPAVPIALGLKDAADEIASLRTALFQEREAREKAEKALELCTPVLCGQNELFPPERVGCGQPITREIDVFRCTDCATPFHRECAKAHFGEHGEEAAREALANLAHEMRFLLRQNPEKDGGLYRQRLDEADRALALASGECPHKCEEGGICLAEHSGFPQSCPRAARFLSQEPNHER